MYSIQPEQHELLAKNQEHMVQGQMVQGQMVQGQMVQGQMVQGYNNPQVMMPVGPGFQPPQQQMQFMPRPEGIPGVPPGLEYLTQISQLLVHQQVELLEILSGWEGENKYQIKNTLGQQVYFAAEESGGCERQCCGSSRGFIMHITDNLGQEVLRVTRDFKCCAGWNCCACSECCAFEIRVEAPVGQVIGYSAQLQSCTRPRYSIMDAGHQEILYVEGPLCVCQGICCTWDQEFRIMAQDRNQEIGKIAKQWTGIVREMTTDADNFSISFPVDLDVRIKAVLLGLLFLIDFMHFEQKQNKNQRR